MGQKFATQRSYMISVHTATYICQDENTKTQKYMCTYGQKDKNMRTQDSYVLPSTNIMMIRYRSNKITAYSFSCQDNGTGIQNN